MCCLHSVSIQKFGDVEQVNSDDDEKEEEEEDEGEKEEEKKKEEGEVEEQLDEDIASFQVILPRKSEDVLKDIWTYKCDLTRGLSVSSVAWNSAAHLWRGGAVQVLSQADIATEKGATAAPFFVRAGRFRRCALG